MKLINAKDVGEMLGYSDKWVYAMAARGEIPCVRLGRGVRFDPEDIKKWFESLKNGRQN